MIIGSIATQPYPPFIARSEGLWTAVSWLKTDAILASPGRHKLLDDRIFAIVEEYDTIEQPEQRIVETHRRFVDVQFVVEGAELIDWWDALRLRPSGEYDQDRDLQLHDHRGLSSLPIVLECTNYAVFLPDDAHRPKGAVGGVGRRIRKAVVKVDISLL